MEVRLDMAKFRGKYEAELVAESRARVYLVKAGEAYVLKVYEGEGWQERAREIASRLRAFKAPYVARYPELEEVIYQALPLDFGIAELEGSSHPACLFKYLPKPTLQELLDDGSGDWEPEVVVRQLALGVAVFHGLGIVHSDLTPPNLLVGKGLTIIDYDGGGILWRGGWRLKPLVAGRLADGLPNAPEGRPGKGFDRWWLAINAFILASKGVNPFFFLTNAELESLKELRELASRSEACWPPPYEVVRRHSRFNRSVRREHLKGVRELVGRCLPTSLFYEAFVEGLEDPSKRPRASDYLASLGGEGFGGA
mgnify:CR=1 FL=1